MPTGYTAGIEDGSINTAKEFIIQCSRAFGAMIMMRDEPLNAPIPEEFQPNSYYTDSLEKARNELAELDAMTDEKIDNEIELENWNTLYNNRRYRKEIEEKNKKYADMLVKINEWNPPSKEHIELKNFCINQIAVSADTYTLDELEQYYPLEKPKPTREEWKAAKKATFELDIEYYSKKLDEEIKRINERNLWIKQLRESLVGFEL